MSEMKETNSFIEELLGKQSCTSSNENGAATNLASTEVVTPLADSIANFVALAILFIGIIVFIVGLITGIALISKDDSWWILPLIGLGSFIVSVINWAFYKVFLNMSRNLYCIIEILNDLKKR